MRIGVNLSFPVNCFRKLVRLRILMKSALILGGTGQIGSAISNRLLSLDWSVTVTSRNKILTRSNVRHEIVDARNSDSLSKALATPVDLLVSCVAYDINDSIQLLNVADKVGRVVVISSASVYQDQKGRTLDEARISGFPHFEGPMDENTLTVQPGPQTYSTQKIAMERKLIEQGTVPVNVLRPCAVHGPFSNHAREWWFVKRILDGRTRIPLAYEGKSQFQTSSVEAIADSVVMAAAGNLPIIANVCDADSPSVLEIGKTIARVMRTEIDFVGLKDTAYPPVAGATPWSLPRNFTLSSVSPGKLRYAETVSSTIEWLVKNVNNQNWSKILHHLASYPYSHFDYAIDDAALFNNE